MENPGERWEKPRMARSDFAALLDRHVGEGEALAGGRIVPVLTASSAAGASGIGHVAAAMMHGNRWPALYGGFFFDLAHRAGALAVEAVARTAADPLSLEVHFLRAVRRVDVPEAQGLTVAWRADVAPPSGARPDHAAVVVDIGEEGALFAKAFAWFAVTSRARGGAGPSPDRLVLPCHDAGWSAGRISGRSVEPPGSVSAVSDTMLAKAAATVRGDGCPETHVEHFLARTLAYTWIRPVDDGAIRYEARIVHRGRRMGLAAADIHCDGSLAGRVTGTIVFQQVPR